MALQMDDLEEGDNDVEGDEGSKDKVKTRAKPKLKQATIPALSLFKVSATFQCPRSLLSDASNLIR